MKHEIHRGVLNP